MLLLGCGQIEISLFNCLCDSIVWGTRWIIYVENVVKPRITSKMNWVVKLIECQIERSCIKYVALRQILHIISNESCVILKDHFPYWRTFREITVGEDKVSSCRKIKFKSDVYWSHLYDIKWFKQESRNMKI